MKQFHMVSFLLVIVGALNWGLVGLLNFNLVMMILGSVPILEKLAYILVGLSAVNEVLIHKDICNLCSKMMKK